MKNKKAQEYSFRFVTVLILSLAVLFLVFLLYNKITSNYETVPGNAECKSSILLASKFGEWNSKSINCPTNYVTFNKNEPEKIKKRIAEGASGCWNKFGSGKLQLFEHKPSSLEYFGDDVVEYCNVCEVYEFNDVPLIPNFGDFLINENVSKIYLDNGEKSMSYLSYFTGVLVDESTISEIPREINNSEIDTSKLYVSLFVYTKDPSFFQQQYLFNKALNSELFGFVYYGSLGLMFGRDVGAQWYSYIMIVPYEKEQLKKVCANLQD